MRGLPLFGAVACAILTACNASTPDAESYQDSVDSAASAGSHTEEAPDLETSDPAPDAMPNETALERDAQAAINEAVARPVMYGGEADLDACGGVGEVSGLKSDGENFLAVRALPSIKGSEEDRLSNGQQVIICEEDAPWLGIVYDKSGMKDCGTGSPISEATTYIGPCDTGWVASKYVTLIAG